MSLWIIATLAAASFQTLRFMLQKMLAASTLSASGATFARFLYSAPLVALSLAVYLGVTETALPDLNLAFWGYGALGGVAQIFATVCVVLLFKTRNFVVGITLKKTETIQTVLVGWILLGEGVSLLAFACILIGVFGVLLLSDPPTMAGETVWQRVWSRATVLGLGSGVMFAVSGVSYRAASLELDSDAPLLRAGVTLAAVTMMQMIAMACWLWLRAPGEISRVWAARRTASLVGLSSMAGSFCWFTAFTTQSAAYVNALGQVELIISLAVSVLFFKEKVTMREMGGVSVLGLSILGLVSVV